MQILESTILGEGKNLIILHGLFGNGKNWSTLAKKWSKHFCVHSLDARNHGKSMADEQMDYTLMAQDVMRYMRHKNIDSAYILGHSMGGKTAMQLANLYPSMVKKLIILDITSSAYPAHHELILQALDILHEKKWDSRAQANAAMDGIDLEAEVKQFLLTDLIRDSEGKLELQLKFANIKSQYMNIMAQIDFNRPLNMPCLLLGGSLSNYVNAENLAKMRDIFTDFTYMELPTNHWIHSKAQKLVEKYVIEFCD